MPSSSPALRSLALLALALPVACGKESRFFIVQNQVPEAGCTIPGGRGSTYRGEGRVDVSLVGGDAAYAYRMFPLLQNDLPANASAGSPEPNRLTLRGFRVRVELAGEPPAAARQVFAALAADPAGQRLLDFEEPWSSVLDPGSTRAAGIRALPAEIVRQLVAAGAVEGGGTLRLSVVLRGLATRQEGDLETPDFRYPLRLCAGCLVNAAGTCPVETLRNPGNPCNLAQDDPVDCCQEGSTARCPAPARTASPPPDGGA